MTGTASCPDAPASPEPVPHAAVTREITPRAPGAAARLRELWRFRRLMPYFGRRALEKRYLRTWLGAPWIVLRPTLDIGSRALLFGGLLGVPSQGIPYPIFLLVGMSAWQLFDRTAFWAMRSLEMNRGLLRQVYVPRLTVVAGALAPSGAEYLVYVAITILAVAGYWIGDGTMYLSLGPETALALAGLLMVLALAFAIGMVLSVYALQARDIRFLFGYILGFWLLLTPVLYPLSGVPEIFQVIAEFNPMTAPIEMVKQGLLGVGEVTTRALVTSLVCIVVGGLAALKFFDAAESHAGESA